LLSQSKRDLGFIEGDLIECLNAGDGSWWMGRLRRDKRMMGLFPSNFVQVLDDSFQPASRASSPMPERSPSPNPFNPQPPKDVKIKAFRKPFQAYAAPDLVAQKRADIQKEDSLLRTKGFSTNPKTANNIISRDCSQNSYSVHDNISRVPSPEQFNGYGSRAHSPAPPFSSDLYSRTCSPVPGLLETDSPPPPPPPHRQAYTLQTRQASNSWHTNGLHTPRATSPCPPSPGASALTPSPLRMAMEDVMSSLHDMGISQETESPEQSLDPWSPEAFDQTYIRAARHNIPGRPNTSMGILGPHQEYQDHTNGNTYEERDHSTYLDERQPPELSNYVARMETRLQKMHQENANHSNEHPGSSMGRPAVPLKMDSHESRPKSSMGGSIPAEPKLRHRKSAFEVGRQMLERTFTTTNGSSSTQATERSIMSGQSAGAFSSTSAGSLARKKQALQSRAQSAMGTSRDDFLTLNGGFDNSRPQTPISGITFHSSHDSQPLRSQSQAGWHENTSMGGSVLGGLVTPRPKKSGFFKKIIESAKTSAASARSSIAAGESVQPSAPTRSMIPDGVTAIAGGFTNAQSSRSAAHEMGLGGPGVDWVQVRRDINRSNSLSRIERVERRERCQMMDYPALSPVEELYEATEGDEGIDGMPVVEPTNFQTVNLSLVDKNTRFINSLPPMTNPMSLATGYVCRPYKSDVQRLRAIFTWVSEKISWEEEFEGNVDPRRVIQTKRGCAEDVAVLVMEMCAAIGIHCEVVRGYLKSPGEVPEIGQMPRSNHWWNAVLADGEWRMMDCSLASPTNPRRSLYSSTGPGIAETWWFLARPMEICWTHIPEHQQQQHICPPVARDILQALPCACPPFFKNMLELADYDTSLLRTEDLEFVHIKFIVPADVECVAEVEARAFERDADGDLFESGEVVKKRALAQAEWIGGQKRYTVKALLPGDEGHGVLKVYAGKRGLMHSIKDIPHPLALALPIIHTGENPPYDFLTRHPTPHAQRHDLYVAQPQCQRLAVNNTFVFAVRQHPSSLSPSSPNPGGTSPIPFMRPSSAMSMTASSASGSNPSTFSTKKPAKLAIQAPGGKILRLMRKEDRGSSTSQNYEATDGGTWETIIKCGEKGIWRGLVLADRSARWCVFAEWICV
jgi:transglutaminase/protease-like cytokinesis protein 3